MRARTFKVTRLIRETFEIEADDEEEAMSLADDRDQPDSRKVDYDAEEV